MRLNNRILVLCEGLSETAAIKTVKRISVMPFCLSHTSLQTRSMSEKGAASVVELADTLDSKSSAERRIGSNPIRSTIHRNVAQVGRAPALGAGCRGFESLHSDQSRESPCGEKNGLLCELFSRQS